MAAKKTSGLWPVLVKFPVALLDELDAEAERIGITRVALIFSLLDEALAVRRSKNQGRKKA